MKLTENVFTFYSLDRPTEEEENLNERLVIANTVKKYICRSQKVVFHF